MGERWAVCVRLVRVTEGQEAPEGTVLVAEKEEQGKRWAEAVGELVEESERNDWSPDEGSGE